MAFDHSAKLYDGDDRLIPSVVRYLVQQHAGGRALLVLCTREHRRELRAALAKSPVRDAELIWHDPNRVHLAPTAGEAPAWDAFHGELRRLLHELGAPRRRVAIYSELGDSLSRARQT